MYNPMYSGDTQCQRLSQKVAGHQGLQLQKVVGPDEKLSAQKTLITNNK